ncbi:MAG: DUF1501 domain-containing protein [Planctomycetaceae bacterium]
MPIGRNPLHVTRRRALQIGALGGFGITLPRLLQAEAAGGDDSNSASRIKSCILLFYYGGPSQLDTYDMKPNAPANVRGEFQGIQTSAPGVTVCEHLPMTARVMDRVAVIRSMHHPMTNHNAAAVEALCGRTPLRGDLELLNDDRLSFPCYGAAMSYVWRHEQLELPAVALPHVMYNVVQLPGQTTGFLESAYQPFQIDKDPNAPDFGASSLALPGDMSARRLQNRESLLGHLDEPSGAAVDRARSSSMRTYYEKAFSLLASPTVQKSLHIGDETPATRDRFGRNKLGQSLLLARRLVESGVRFITVYDGVANCQTCNWDSHADNFPRNKNDLLPPADRAFSALIEDLDQRGLLETTLVVALGEFGRTPRINANGGRDHWPYGFSVVLAGGGVKGGYLYGTSDAIAAYPASNPVSPGDLAATLYWRFGIDSHTSIHDFTGRPHRLAEGEPIRELFGDSTA